MNAVGGFRRGGGRGGPPNKKLKYENSLYHYLCPHCKQQTEKGMFKCSACQKDMFPPGYIFCGACKYAFPKVEFETMDNCRFCGNDFEDRGIQEKCSKKKDNK